MAASSSDHHAELDANAVKVAILYDPVKLEEKEDGYPSPALTSALSDNLMPIHAEEISLPDLLDGALLSRRFTLICVPGGFAPNFVQRLGTIGLERIKEFVASGGGYVGLCAGAYLGSIEGLALLPIEIVDVHRWARGSGPCQLRFTRDGAKAVGALSGSNVQPVTVRYANGPIMRICGASVATLAVFATEFRGWRGDYPPAMDGTPAVVIGRQDGTGGVVALVSPHMEDGTDERSLTPFCNLFRLASRASPMLQWLLRIEADISPELRAALESPR